MTRHSMIRRSFSKECTYNDKKHPTLQKEAERRSKTLVPVPAVVSHLQFLMRAVICKELFYKIKLLELGFLRPG